MIADTVDTTTNTIVLYAVASPPERIARILARSPIFPERYQKSDEVLCLVRIPKVEHHPSDKNIV